MSQFDIHGFDLEAQTIIAKRHTILQKFLRPRWGSESLMLDSISEKEEAVRAEAETISKSFADIEYQELSLMLGLFETVLKGILHARWSVGVFTPMSPLEAMRARKTPKSPALEIIIQRVQAILSSVSNQAEWEAAFIEGDTPLCRDADSAKRLAKDIAGIPATATKMARALFQSWLKQGRVALLEHANYPCLGVLQRLERHRATMTSVLIEPELVTACLRADLVALQRTLQNKQLDHQAKKLSKSPIQLWDESLCHQPPESKQRTLYQSRMVPELCARILPELQAQRGCDGDYAAQLFNYFLRGGIDGLLIWHCGEVALEIRKRQMVQLFQQ